MSRPPSEKVISRRLGAAVDHARGGDDVVLVVDQLEHVRQMMAELQLSKGAVDLVQVDRRNGAEQLRFRGGGRIRFAPAANPDSLRGWQHVDLFLVDPRVATTTALEQAMALACHGPNSSAGVVVRPGDRP